MAWRESRAVGRDHPELVTELVRTTVSGRRETTAAQAVFGFGLRLPRRLG